MHLCQRPPAVPRRCVTLGCASGQLEVAQPTRSHGGAAAKPTGGADGRTDGGAIGRAYARRRRRVTAARRARRQPIHTPPPRAQRDERTARDE